LKGEREQGVLSDNFLKQAQNNTIILNRKRWTGWDLNPRPQHLAAF
jgi:hypothetical protein